MILTLKRTTSTIALGLALLTMTLGGCQEEGGQPGGFGTSQSLLITPEFRVEGLDELRGELLLQDMYLGIGEIRLEPIGHGDGGLVYVTRAPFPLHIDFAEGDSASGPQIALPHPGEYLISITVEPVSTDGSVLGDKSMRLDGLMAKWDRKVATDGKKAAGEPVPLPWRVLNEGGDDEDAAPIRWVPWTYASERNSFVKLNDVHFSASKSQTLVISFDLNDWLNEAFMPINDAVDTHALGEFETEGEEIDFEPVAIDVSSAVDNLGEEAGDLTSKTEAYVR